MGSLCKFFIVAIMVRRAGHTSDALSETEESVLVIAHLSPSKPTRPSGMG